MPKWQLVRSRALTMRQYREGYGTPCLARLTHGFFVRCNAFQDLFDPAYDKQVRGVLKARYAVISIWLFSGPAMQLS